VNEPLLTGLAGVAAVTGNVSGWVVLAVVGRMCVQQLVRYQAERARWRTIERLVEAHGPAVLDVVPKVVRELNVACCCGPGGVAATCCCNSALTTHSPSPTRRGHSS
jgi:hypothetical protein